MKNISITQGEGSASFFPFENILKIDCEEFWVKIQSCFPFIMISTGFVYQLIVFLDIETPDSAVTELHSAPYETQFRNPQYW